MERADGRSQGVRKCGRGSLFDVLGHWVARLEKSVLFGCTCWNTWVCIVLPCLKEKKKKELNSPAWVKICKIF